MGLDLQTGAVAVIGVCRWSTGRSASLSACDGHRSSARDHIAGKPAASSLVNGTRPCIGSPQFGAERPRQMFGPELRDAWNPEFDEAISLPLGETS